MDFDSASEKKLECQHLDLWKLCASLRDGNSYQNNLSNELVLCLLALFTFLSFISSVAGSNWMNLGSSHSIEPQHSVQ